jgi:hypothetical protein
MTPLTETAQRIVRTSRHPITFTFIRWLSGCSLRKCDQGSGSFDPTHAWSAIIGRKGTSAAG